MRKKRLNPKSKFVCRHYTQLLAVCPPKMAQAYTRSSLANKQQTKISDIASRLWPLCKHLVIVLLKQWSSCLPAVNLFLSMVYKRSADQGASIRGCIMSEWVVHMPWPLHYGHNMSRSVTMYSIAHRCWVAWEKDDRIRRASLCIGIIRNCWPFVHLKWRKLIRGLH